MYAPLSTEWVILHSEIFKNDVEIQNILNNPCDYIDSSYTSREEFYERILKSKLPKVVGYSKKSVPKCIYCRCCVVKNMQNGLYTCQYVNNLSGKSKLESLTKIMPINFTQIKQKEYTDGN